MSSCVFSLVCLFATCRENFAEISPSTLFAVACILENVPYINGSPPTFVPVRAGSRLLVLIPDCLSVCLSVR